MNNIYSFSYEFLPDDLKNVIFPMIKNDLKMILLNKGFRDIYYQNLREETNQKIGLYQKNLILAGLPLVQEIYDLEKQIAVNKTVKADWGFIVEGLFLRALLGPLARSNSRIALDFVPGDEAIEAKTAVDNVHKLGLKVAGFTKNLEIILKMRKNENTLYKFCGGKDKFHQLKVFNIPREIKSVFCYSSLENAVRKGNRIIMRGITNMGCPGIVIENNRECKIYYQLSLEFPQKWVKFDFA